MGSATDVLGLREENGKLKGEMEALRQQLKEYNRINNLTRIEKNKLEKKVKELRAELDKRDAHGLDHKLNRINAMDLGELSVLKSRLHQKMKLIEDTEKILMETSLNCIACTDNKKNIVFMDGCSHVALCDECEAKMERKVCPLCSVPYSRIKKLTI